MSIWTLEPDPQVQSGVAWVLCIEATLLFEIGGMLVLFDQAGGERARISLADLGAWLHWLPQGHYRLRLGGGFPGATAVQLSLEARYGREGIRADAPALPLPRHATSEPLTLSWSGDPDPGLLPHRRGLEDWFHRHFDHAALVIGEYLLKDSPLLSGRILDLGCGDGITDLGLFWRWQPELLVGIDPCPGFLRLPTILAERRLPPALLASPRLVFLRADGSFLPFRDDSFDVVVSWGSLEHIAGGHHQALVEVRRVLKPDGLFFAHPGLYYSNLGHHLGEFSDEPFVHLKRSREALRELVLSTTPRYIDRAGEFASPAQYWQWFSELNRITVASFEQELRALDFEPWRVALRSEPIIEYTSELLPYPMSDLAIAELYVACFNRKRRPRGR